VGPSATPVSSQKWKKIPTFQALQHIKSMAGALLMETKHLNVMLSKWIHQNHNELGKH
jgi:hypothetical protein